jgi:hypothetical protein
LRLGYFYQWQFINNLIKPYASALIPELSNILYRHGTFFQNGISMYRYYKDIPRINPIYQNLRDPLEVFPEARNDVVKLNISGTTAKGIELFLKYDRGKKISWWVSYALAKAEDDIKSIEFNGLLTPQVGKTPRTTGQTHTIYADLNYRPNEKWHFSVWIKRVAYRTNYHTIGKQCPMDD